MEKISVIVPVYNTEKYLEQCINSLLQQDYLDYEIILIDDGSSDQSAMICDKYAKKEHMCVIHQENAGVSAARNSGLHIAKGKYITFVDSDDWVEQDYISNLASNMHQGGMAVCGLKNEYENDLNNAKSKNQMKAVCIEMDRKQAELSVIHLDGIGGFCHSKMFDMEIIRENGICFCENITQCEDHLFVIQYLSCTTELTRWDRRVGYHYRQHTKSTMNSRYRKVAKFDLKIFTMLTAFQEEERYVEHDLKILQALKARQTKAMTEHLIIFVINKWCGMTYYRELLKEARKGLCLYLQCDIGESIKGRISTILCCISPHVCYIAWKLYGYI